MITIDPPSTLPIPTEPQLSKSALTRFLNQVRRLLEIPGQVSVLLTTDAELKRLNRTFRKKNKPTDILSFPALPEISAEHAGDLAISLETAARQAALFGHSLRDEVRILLLHGLLHLSGLDHETDQGEMAAREAELRAALKLPTTLIARATKAKDSTKAMEAAKAKDAAKGMEAAKAKDAATLKNRAKGPSHTSLGQRPRSRSTVPRKRAESPIHNARPRSRRTP